ncbi:MAG: hypothetical protein BGO44_01380 [Legionella sp. 39-23]|nr:MAG: hypothetical protein BGO44_01380 [Legionella sp. 39-23]
MDKYLIKISIALTLKTKIINLIAACCSRSDTSVNGRLKIQPLPLSFFPELANTSAFIIILKIQVNQF